jgi:dTDP-4-amino-4,6-dideoxygalactose transaminase
MILVVAQKLKLINLEVTGGEKVAQKPLHFPAKLCNAMAKIALIQLAELGNFNKKRRAVAEHYFKHLKIGQKINPVEFPGAIFLRYPVQIKDTDKVLKVAKDRGIILGDWYNTPVAPVGIDEKKSGYKRGECFNCEKTNARVINLPTHHSLREKDLEKIVQIVNQYAEN